MQAGNERFLTVVTGTCSWAVPLSAVVNIITKGLHSPVPLLPPWHLGVFYYEGEVLPFYDLGQYTGGAVRPWKLVIVCKLETELIALAADAVGETIFGGGKRL